MDQSPEIIAHDDVAAGDEDDDLVLLGGDDVSDFNEANILPQSPETIQKIKQWLCPTDYAAVTGEFRRHLTSHLAGTVVWPYATDAYRQWHDTDSNGLLWIKGIPGAGKSVFAASLVRKLQQEETPVLYFFFRQIVRANHEPISLLRDWLTQILPYSPPLQAKLKEYLDMNRTLDSLSTADMFKDLKLACTYLPKVYCITDALDEMDVGNDQFLQELAQFGCWRPSKVKMIITSRPVPAVEIPLRTYQMLHIRLHKNLVDADIASYVQSRLDSSEISEENQAKIRDAVPGRANGLFLYAKLAMDQIMEAGADIPNVLAVLPADLNVMYTDLLREHSRRSGMPPHVQLLILQWATHASRPLRLLEMAEMLSATQQLDEIRELKDAKALIRATCGPLLEILPDETVCVIHHSLKEFLIGSTRTQAPGEPTNTEYPVLELGPTHERLALSCLSYLNSGCLDKGELRKDKTFRDFRQPRKLDPRLRLEYPFAEYAAFNWHVHAVLAASVGSKQPDLQEMLDTFLQGNRFLVWLDLEWPSDRIDGVSPLHVAARFGLTDFSRALLERPGASPNAVNKSDESVLYWAAHEGQDETIRLLLQRGADPNKPTYNGLTPIHAVARQNHPAAAQALILAGVDPLTPRTDPMAKLRQDPTPEYVGDTPLQYACQNGYEEVVAVLLSCIKDIKAMYKALHWAAVSGKASVVKRILEHSDVDVNAFISGNTALYDACKAFDPQTIEVLLRAGANVNVLTQPMRYPRPMIIPPGSRTPGGIGALPNPHEQPNINEAGGLVNSVRGPTALHVLCSKVGTHPMDIIQQCFQLVQEAGVDVNQRDSDGQTALHILLSRLAIHASGGTRVMLQLLLGAGADANAEADNGGTPLHGQLSIGKDIIRILVEEGGADINKRRSSDGKTPLLSLLASQMPETSLEFLSFGPDCHIVDNDGNGPFHAALSCRRTNSNVLTALMKAGAEPNLKNNSGQTALHMCKQDNLLDLMVEAGASLEEQDNDGRTILFQRAGLLSSRGGVNPDLKIAIQLGAKTDCVDHKGRTLLHEATRHDCYDNLKYLLDLGMNPHVQDNAGNNLWHEAITGRCYSIEARPINWPPMKGQQDPDMYDTLIKIGVDPDQANHHGTTPLHIACSIGIKSNVASHRKLPLDYIIDLCKDKSPVDCDGNTPLHLAATISEYHVAALLKAGANVAAVNAEGLTPLHLASRACQPNIVGMLLTEYQRRKDLNNSALLDFVNHLDGSGRTALHYACRSGRPETVALLLASGANVNVWAKDGATPLRECTLFESEQELWRGCGSADQTNGVYVVGLKSAGLKLDDNSRPHLIYTDRGSESATALPSEHISARIEEILDMLTSAVDLHTTDAFGRTQVEEAVNSLSGSPTSYTAKCFLALAERVSRGIHESHGESTLSSSSQKETPATSQETLPTTSMAQEFELRQLLSSRAYDRVEDRYGACVNIPQPYRSGNSHLHIFASGGYGRLLEKLCTFEAAKNFEDPNWCDNWRRMASGRRSNMAGSARPLLMVALRSSMPNMNVVKFLVERMKANLDARYGPGSFDLASGQIAVGSTVLHALAKGKHWWHVYEALPYLISQGANVHARDENGCTPLHVALEKVPWNDARIKLFREEAVRLLVEAGADINAVNNAGMSCQALAVADDNPNMMLILLPPGARLDVAPLFIAIQEGDAKRVEWLLPYGVDPNERCNIKLVGSPNDQLGSGIQRTGGTIDQDELYAIMLVDHEANKLEDKAKCITMMKQLIFHGADIYATFKKTVPDASDTPTSITRAHKMVNDGTGVAGKRAPPGHHFEDCTIIHDLLESSAIIQEAIDWESLDLEKRDAKGRTLLLAACRNKSSAKLSIVTRLVEQGVDLSKRDNDGKNALHHILDVRKPQEPCSQNELVKLLLSKRRDLLHEEDRDGNTPINCVPPGSCNMMTRRFQWATPCEDVVDILLDAGADALHPDANGNLPIHVLGARPQHPMFQRFLDMGIPINVRNTKNGNTPLFTWFSSEPSRIDSHLSARERQNLGGTPQRRQPLLARPTPIAPKLPEQAELENFERDQLEFYNNAGADFMIRNNAGETVLHVLASASYGSPKGNAKTLIARFKYLVDKGLDPMAEDKQQRTALDVAVACGNTCLLELFKRKPHGEDEATA